MAFKKSNSSAGEEFAARKRPPLRKGDAIDVNDTSRVGETGTFTLPDELAVENARVAAQDVKRLYHYNLERVKTDDALTISFKRLS